MKAFFWAFLALLVFASFQQVLAKTVASDYIDLLDLSDNDEFQWGERENELHSLRNYSEENGVVNYLSRHRLNKRQAPTSQLLVRHPGKGPYLHNNSYIFNLQENKDYGPCSTPLGESGRCRHIIYCRMPELKNDVWRLVSQLCIIEKSSIGICCTDQMTSNRFSPQIVTSQDQEEPRIVNKPEQRGCGITTRQYPRLTGGRPAEPDEWPWMAALLREGLPFVWCGGALITDRHVLTAAHCIHGKKKEDIFVRLGEYNTHMVNETRARDFRIANMVIHIDFNPQNYDNDIAIVRIDRATLFNTYIWPVCMPPVNEDWTGRNAIVTGWGTQMFGGPHSNILMEVNLPVWKMSECRTALVQHVPDTALCAGFPEGGQDSCQGDSGGPLLVQLPNQRWVTIGIVSWGVGCGQRGRPGIYTRVDRYLDWILANADA
ncbi:hypothetical protein KR054_012057 [Drosophila jambulina]|nr:hypothetical protein KR054_012057 [Drosophila jambulina]